MELVAELIRDLRESRNKMADIIQNQQGAMLQMLVLLDEIANRHGIICQCHHTNCPVIRAKNLVQNFTSNLKENEHAEAD